jgi:predicted secreted protein
VPVRPLLVILAAFVLAGTAAAHEPRVMGIGQKQNGESTAINLGDTLVVTLPANAGTSFNWRLAAVTRTVLRPDANGYVPALRPPLAQGAAGVAVFIFKAVKVGKTTLRINYIKTGVKAPAKIFTTTVTVRPKEA